MDKGELTRTIEREIKQSHVIKDTVKDKIIKTIITSKNINQNAVKFTWFDCKMILFRNKRNNITKDQFFQWLNLTHIQDFVEYKN